ncbi:tyrosine-type recombinase/integrase [Thiocystis minor]|uniref:tyrosine-type recombinase/integrase n=1 Tax=Thiocystis minor TaxID=61597 RepID=UPI0030B875AA
MPLTDVKVRTAKPRAKTVKLHDERGLYLELAPSGGKWWRFKFRFAGKENRLSLGVYPDVSLKQARERRDEARKILAAGVDPAARRKAEKAAGAERAGNTFEVIAREWFARHSPGWAESYRIKITNSLANDLFPWLGSRPIAEIGAPELLATARRVEARGSLYSAHRTIGTTGQIFRYGIATGRTYRDPSGDLRGALPPAKGKHFAAVTDPARVGDLLRMLDGYRGTVTVCAALKLAPLVFVRPGELRKAEWSDFDLDSAERRYRSTKTDTAHIVPLPRQAVAILRDLPPRDWSRALCLSRGTHRRTADVGKRRPGCPAPDGDREG